MNTQSLPTHADVVVIGGGIIGCSTAYHLARDYKLNVVLLEQNKITSGSTWHAAGLVGQLRSSASITQVLKYSVELYKKLEFETGQQTGWKMTGCLRLARTQDRWIEFKRLATTARSFGMDMHLLSPAEAQKLWPLMRVDDLIGASFLPTDGQASPTDITQALVKGGRQYGARFFEQTRVEDIKLHNRQVTSIITNMGEIYTEKVVNCAGVWARQLGAMSGVNIPLVPVKHQYVITEKIPGLASDAPTIRDPDRRTYFKEEVGGLVFGGYEPNPIAWDSADVPPSFEFQLFDDDWDHFEQHMAEAVARVPALEKAGIKRMINGPESFTPDGNFILGRAPELNNYFVGCGFNAFGIASGGGAGWVLASWVKNNEAPTDLWPVDIRRFSNIHHDTGFNHARTLEAYAKHYAVAFPQEEFETARNKIVSPLFDQLKQYGAVMGSKLGWERANWFASDRMLAKDVYAMGRQNWFEAVRTEHHAVRNQCGLFDQSSFAKFEVSGDRSMQRLNKICANNIDKPVGSVTYTQLLNSRGGIECDLTVSRLAQNRFFIVTGTGFRTHDFAWLRDRLEGQRAVALADVTEEFGTLSLMGPQSRVILQMVAKDDTSNSSLPFARCKSITIADHQLWCLRITYVGELGYELHCPIAALPAVFNALHEAGMPLGMKLCGYRAIESLRLEKSYRAWGADITANDTPLEAGLGWATKLKSKVGFVGRAALEKQSALQLKKLLTTFTTEREDIVLVGRETILRNGEFAGYLTSGGYGYTIGKPIGMGYVRNPEGVTPDYIMNATYELVVANEAVKATPSLSSLYDPKNERVRA